ncbi:hypothetical protein [Dictyobacter aurantiacus]|uniref:Uncharacterized protein n=1 Tax=Dictyobacter aurantiacus TaxID=1936993 RepID=A0A401ZQL6_9CHLR|nr:hypothetical protein [Dictyobacter aurantiacus]GCE09173.1 hypothetical protein KDAU_65020 [Dictyobacter aurantiacus]
MTQADMQEKLHVIQVDRRDQLTTVLEIVKALPSQNLLLVLSGIAAQRCAFGRAHDFHELHAQNKKQMFLVIPEEDRLARQWAKENGFSLVFSSLEDVTDHIAHVQPEAIDKQHLDPHLPQPAPTVHETKLLQQKRVSQRPMKLLLVALSLLTLLTAAFFVFVQQQSIPAALSQSPPLASQVTGQVAFESSRIYNQEGTSGVCDQVHLALQHLSSPTIGNAYYAWLLGDKNVSDGRPLLLGMLLPHGGVAELTYRDPRHRNLLASYSQFLVTEESQSAPPIAPSPDSHVWRSVGSIAQTPSPSDSHHYSLLDHLRHLLVQDPTLEALGLHSGLDYWQYKHCGKLIEWTQSARDDWGQADVSFMRRQLIRTLDYIDGTAYVYQDVSAGTPLLVDPKLLRIGLIDVTQTQALEGYFPHITSHLTSITTSPGVTMQQKQNAATIITAINGIIQMLQQARHDAKVLLAMSDEQLHQSVAQTLLDDLANLTNDVYTGNATQQGSIWVHQQIEQLATFSVKQA